MGCGDALLPETLLVHPPYKPPPPPRSPPPPLLPGDPTYSYGLGVSCDGVNVTGPCHITDDGKCGQSDNFPKAYGANARCEFTCLPADSILRVLAFNLQPKALEEAYSYDKDPSMCNFDYVKIGRARFCGKDGPYNYEMGEMTSFLYKTDPAGIRATYGGGIGDRALAYHGFKICWSDDLPPVGPPPPAFPPGVEDPNWPTYGDPVFSYGFIYDPPPSPPLIPGSCPEEPDFDGDAAFRLADAVFVAEAWAGKKELPPGVCGDPPGDFDGDGAFRLADAVFVAEVWAGKKSFCPGYSPSPPLVPPLRPPLPPLAPGSVAVASESELRSLIEGATTDVSVFLVPGAHLKLNKEIRCGSNINVTIASSGEGATLDGQGDTSIFDLRGGCSLTLRGLAIVNGKATMQGGVVHARSAGNIRIVDSTVVGCSAVYGGVVYAMDAGNVEIIDSTVTECSAKEVRCAALSCSAARAAGARHGEGQR